MTKVCSLIVIPLALVAVTALSTFDTRASAASPPKLRLDDAARPTRYSARITVDPAQPTFKGSIDIDLKIARATEVLWLNGTELTVAKAAFTVGGVTSPAKIVAGGENFIGFQADKPLAAGAARLHVEWQGPISRKDDRGLFAQKEDDRWYAITQFEAIFARRVFPCFDEPSVKVPWQLTLEVPSKLVAISNTQVTSEKVNGATKVVTYAETAPLPSYLVAFAVGPYEMVDAGKAGQKKTAVRVAAPFGRGKDAAYAVEVSGKLVELLEQYFGIPFPFDKLDNVAIPITSTFGAMENAGMVTFAQNIMIAKATNRSLHFERGYATTAAHEFAHQWFGDLVTTQWWDDIWLNESFASWMEAKIIDAWKPEWSHNTSFVEARGEALATDALMTARQIRQPIVSNDDIYNAFDAITYQKGESVLAMFERFVGAEKFRAGIKSYLTKHANGNATADDFIGAIAQAAGRSDVTAAFKSFLDQAGAPMVDVALKCEAGKAPSLALSQRRFMPIGSKGANNQTWQIPVCVRWEANGKTERACQLVTKREETMALGSAPACPTWLLANDAEVGYYRAAYSPDLLTKLLGPDGRKKLDLAETVGLLDDVRALVRAGRIPFGDVLALLPSLAQDQRRLVADEVIGIIEGLHQHLVQPAERANYQRLITKLYGEKAHQLGWTPKAGEDEDTRLLRPAVLGLVADEGEDAALRAEARTLALKWIADRKALSPDVAGTALHVAARGGDRALFDKYHAEAKKAADRHDRERLLASLGTFRDPALAKAALKVVSSSEFDPREAMGIVWNLDRDPATRPIGWEYLKANFDQMVKKLSAEMMAYTPMFAVSFCDEPHQKDMESYFHDRSSKLPGGPRLLAQALESIELCRAYVGAQQPSVTAFLKKW
ncbi:MAG: peptidase [Myxococcales bacterium]|nr:peptidase [Myxococcales bacterium]